MGACFIKYQQSHHATVRCWDDIKTDMTHDIVGKNYKQLSCTLYENSLFEEWTEK